MQIILSVLFAILLLFVFIDLYKKTGFVKYRKNK